MLYLSIYMVNSRNLLINAEISERNVRIVYPNITLSKPKALNLATDMKQCNQNTNSKNDVQNLAYYTSL